MISSIPFIKSQLEVICFFKLNFNVPNLLKVPLFFNGNEISYVVASWKTFTQDSQYFFLQVNLLISSSLSNDTKINIFYTFNTSSFGHKLNYVNDYSKLRDCKLHFVTSIIQNFAIYDFYSLICSPTLKMDAKMDAMLQQQYQDGMSMYQLHF
jgi:hypothetical protein